MPSKETNLFMNDYAFFENRSFLDFPPTEIDYLIFSRLVYFNWNVYLHNFFDEVSFVSLYDFSKRTAFLNRVTYRQEDLDLFNAVSGNPRFREVKATHYKSILDNSKLEQFAAIAFILPTGEEIVSFRGTDTTLTGWKENFDMALDSVPSQKDALAYLSQCLHLSSSPFTVVGHSKGGNLAAYSYLSLASKEKERVRSVYDFDGPGLNEKLRATLLLGPDPKIKKYIPSESIVGEIFSSSEGKIIVSSDRHLFEQHFTYYWRLSSDKKSLERERSMHAPVEEAMRRFNNWIKGCDAAEKDILVEAIYTLFSDPSFKTMKDITSHKAASFAKFYASFQRLSPEEKKRITPLIFGLIKAMGGSEKN